MNIRNRFSKYIYRLPYGRSQPTLFDPLSQSIHRHYPFQVDKLFSFFLYLRFGMIHCQWFLCRYFTMHMNSIPGFVIAIHIRHVPPAAVKPR